MRETTLVKLWLQVSRSFLPRGASQRDIETAQNAFLAGALGVFLHLEQAVETGDAARIAATLTSLRRELNLGMKPRSRARRKAPRAPAA